MRINAVVCTCPPLLHPIVNTALGTPAAAQKSLSPKPLLHYSSSSLYLCLVTTYTPPTPSILRIVYIFPILPYLYRPPAALAPRWSCRGAAAHPFPFWSCGRALAARSSSLLGARQGSPAGRTAGGHEDVYTARGTRTFTRRVTHTCPPHRNALYTSAALYTVPTLYTMLEGSPLASA